MIKEFPLNTEYLVSDEGYVLSKGKYGLKRLKAKVDTSTYKRLWLIVNGVSKRMLLHRVIALTFIPNPDELPQVNHIDGNKLNNNAENLEWVTAGDNQRHAYKHGLKNIPKGSLNGRSILTEAIVVEIYNSLLNGESSTSLSDKYNIPLYHINKIKRKDIWKEVLSKFEDIKKQHRSNKLSDEQVEKICYFISKDNSLSETLEKVDFKITKDQFNDIKRKKCYLDISNKYF